MINMINLHHGSRCTCRQAFLFLLQEDTPVGRAFAGLDTEFLLDVIDDTLAALDFLTARSDVNAANVVLWGSSAGAITALYAEYSTDDFGVSGHDVAAVIDNWGGFAGGAGDEDAIDPGEASLHIVHGTNDTVVPYALTEAIIARAAEIGHPVEVYPIEGAGHGVNLHTVEAEPGVTLYQASVDWLDSVLGTNALTN